MKKLPIILLLTASLLLAACSSADNGNSNDLSSDNAGTTSAAATTTVAATDLTSGEDETTAAPESTDEPEVSDDNEAFAELMKKFPIVSAPTGAFAASSSEEMIGNAVEKMETFEDGVMQLKVSISTDMGMLGSQDEKIVTTLMKIGDAYQSVTETISTTDGETSNTTESEIFVDGYYYYLCEDSTDEAFNEKYKIELTREKFDEFILGITDDEIEGVNDFDFSQFTDILKSALEQTAGMTKDGGCSYFSRGINADAIKNFALMDDLDEEMGDYLSEDCLSKIATVVTLDKEGNLKGIYFDLPLEINIEEGDFSMTMAISMQMEITVRKTTADDKIEVPADADSYEEMSIDDYLDLESWFDQDWFDDELDGNGENEPVDDTDI